MIVPSAPALWIFGYGSLLFRPGFPYGAMHAALVRGYRRRLDQGSPDHRGTPDRLGRVATLIPDPDAVTGGAVFGVAATHADEVLRALDEREKGGYDRVEIEAALLGGGAVRAVTWVATRDNPYHLGEAPLEHMVAQIRAAVGPSGPNVEYVLRLAETLRAMGVPDPHVDEVATALRDWG